MSSVFHIQSARGRDRELEILISSRRFGKEAKDEDIKTDQHEAC